LLASLEFQVKIFCIVAVKIKPKLNIQTTATGIKTNHIKLEKDKDLKLSTFFDINQPNIVSISTKGKKTINIHM